MIGRPCSVLSSSLVGRLVSRGGYSVDVVDARCRLGSSDAAQLGHAHHSGKAGRSIVPSIGNARRQRPHRRVGTASSAGASADGSTVVSTSDAEGAGRALMVMMTPRTDVAQVEASGLYGATAQPTVLPKRGDSSQGLHPTPFRLGHRSRSMCRWRPAWCRYRAGCRHQPDGEHDRCEPRVPWTHSG